jgi:hypothetical protein
MLRTRDETQIYLDSLIAAILANDSNITTLGFMHNAYSGFNFEHLDIIKILHALKNNNVIWSISFWGANLGDDGAEIIADILSKQNSIIEYVHLGGANITEKGLNFIIDSQKKNPKLIQFSFSYNQIDWTPHLVSDLLINLRHVKEISFRQYLTFGKDDLFDQNAEKILDTIISLIKTHKHLPMIELPDSYSAYECYINNIRNNWLCPRPKILTVNGKRKISHTAIEEDKKQYWWDSTEEAEESQPNDDITTELQDYLSQNSLEIDDEGNVSSSSVPYYSVWDIPGYRGVAAQTEYSSVYLLNTGYRTAKFVASPMEMLAAANANDYRLLTESFDEQVARELRYMQGGMAIHEFLQHPIDNIKNYVVNYFNNSNTDHKEAIVAGDFSRAAMVKSNMHCDVAEVTVGLVAGGMGAQRVAAKVGGFVTTQAPKALLWSAQKSPFIFRGDKFFDSLRSNTLGSMGGNVFDAVFNAVETRGSVVKTATSCIAENPIMVHTTLYQKVGPNGEHLKFGVTKNPDRRYSQSQLAGGKIKVVASGERAKMLALERKLHEVLPIGPEERQSFYVKKQVDNGLKPPPYGS